MGKGIQIVLDRLHNKYEEKEDFINYLQPLYEEVNPNNLADLFGYFHYRFNKLFMFMNSKIQSGHYNAEQSRELIELILDTRNLLNVLKDNQTSYEIKKSYMEIINTIYLFLSPSGGSAIPNDFNQIDIIEVESIFTPLEAVKVKNETYETKLIGEGSYARVLKYKDTYYNQVFAIKKAKKGLDTKEFERFQQEFETMKKLHSPYILKVYKFNEENNSYIMEYADITLFDFIQKNNTKLVHSQRINIINQVFKAFEYIHGKVGLHRDISTTNILLKKFDDNINIVKISDFGLVKLKESQLTSDNTEFKGSLNDPQLDVVGGFKNYQIQHETYSLTRLLYFIITGKIRIEPTRNKEFDNFINKGINIDVTQRYTSVEEMFKYFKRIQFVPNQQ